MRGFTSVMLNISLMHWYILFNRQVGPYLSTSFIILNHRIFSDSRDLISATVMNPLCCKPDETAFEMTPNPINCYVATRYHNKET